MPAPLRIVLVFPHTLNLEAVRSVLHGDSRFEVVFSLKTLSEALTFEDLLDVELAIVDASPADRQLPQVLTGLRKSIPNLAVLVVGEPKIEATYARELIQAGASGVVTWSISKHRLFEALLLLDEGRLHVQDDIRVAALDLARVPLCFN